MQVHGLLVSLVIVFSMMAELSHGANPCEGKADYEVRLDQPGKSLENSEVVDQDGTGVCYAAASATMLQSVLPGNPDVSYLDYALQYKKAENNNKSAKIVTDPANDETLLDGGSPCDYFSSIKKTGVCSRDNVELEKLNTSDPDLQIESLEGIGRYFDLQKKLSPEKRAKANEVIAKTLDKVREGGKSECAKFPTSMRALLQKVYFEVEKQIEDLKFDLKYGKRSKETLEAEITKYKTQKESTETQISGINTAKEDLIRNHEMRLEKLQGKRDAPLYSVIRKKNERKIQEEIENFNSAKNKLEMEHNAALKSSEMVSSLLLNAQDELKKVAEVEAKIVKANETLKLIGEKTTSKSSPVGNASGIKLSDEIEKKLQSEYREIISKVTPNEFQWDRYQKPAEQFIASLGVNLSPGVSIAILEAKNLEEDYQQLEPDRCLNLHMKKNNYAISSQLSDDLACADSNLATPALELIKSLNSQINANVNTIEILNKLSETPYEFIEEIIGSKCTSKNRIAIPPSLSCVKRETFDMIFDAPGSPSFNSQKAYSIVSNQFNSDSFKSINKGRSLYLGVCADMFDYTDADSGYGRSCNSGGHAVSMVGYRCKGGKVNYLIQNSWGSFNPPSGDSIEKSNGRVWIPEKLLIKNLRRYGTIEGNIK